MPCTVMIIFLSKGQKHNAQHSTITELPKHFAFREWIAFFWIFCKSNVSHTWSKGATTTQLFTNLKETIMLVLLVLITAPNMKMVCWLLVLATLADV